MPILDLQKRARELGRIRLGVQETFTKRNGEQGTRPAKLDRFRFTGHSHTLISKVAELYGGEVREWTPAGGTQQWEVISNATRVPIMVPPQPVSQWYEFWTRAGVQHRCDGQRNVLTDEPCDPEDPKHIEAVKKPTTRLNVVLRDVEGIGVWRVETHGFNAAIELPDVAEFLAAAGGYVNGWLSLEQRTSIEQTDQGPKTRHFLVPIIEVDVTPAQLMAGHGRVAAPALAGGPVTAAPALAAAGPDYVALAAEITDPEEIKNLWRQASAAGHMTQGLSDHLQKRAAELTEAAQSSAAGGGDPAVPPVQSAAASPAAEPDAEGVYDAEVVDDDADQVWQQIVTEAGKRDMLLPDLEDDVATFFGGMTSSEASGAELAEYLKDLQGRPVEAVA
jgi:hypothetical protein